MYRLNVKKEKHRYVLEELAKEFLRPEEYEVFVEEKAETAEGSSDQQKIAAGEKKALSEEQRRTENEERMRRNAGSSTSWQNSPVIVRNGGR